MSQAELIFCLRDVHRYWSTPRISSHEMEELERQKLIQRSPAAICAIRLTEQGVLVKKGQQLKAPERSGRDFSPATDDKAARLSQ